MQVVISDLPSAGPGAASAGGGHAIAKLIYNTVTTLLVGEKTVISMPTWFFSSDVGPRFGGPTMTDRDKLPNPAGFQFSEPIIIDKQQNFRVEIEAPDARSLREIQGISGPLMIWVVLDGLLITTRRKK